MLPETIETASRHVRPRSDALYSGPIKQWAILVGISKYKHEEWNLKYAHRDAEELYKLIQTASGGGFEANRIEKLINEEATTRNVTRALRGFLTQPAKEDLVLIYFACHGGPDPRRPKLLYLLTHDTDPKDISGTALRMDEIERSLRDYLLAERVVIIADTCHSAAIGATGGRDIGNTAEITNRYLEEVSKAKRGVALLTSAEASERALEDERWDGGHGVFTYFLLKGMKGEADGHRQPKDGKVTVGELFEYVRESVRNATNDQQHPAIGTAEFDRNLLMAVTGGVDAAEHYALGCRLYDLGWRLDDVGRFESACRQFGEALRLSRSAGVSYPEAETWLGKSWLAAGEYDKAVRILQDLTDRDPANAPSEAWFYLGIAGAKRRDHDGAVHAFDEFVARDSRNKNAAWVIEYSQLLRRRNGGKKRALLIGINEYRSGFPKLQGCVNDVELLKGVLTHKFRFEESDMMILIDKAATRQAILHAFQTLSRGADRADML
jgi:tetratricopeptide (TPR) repeat protein